MTYIDIILIIAFFIGTFKGLKNGLFVEFSSFVGLLVGLWVALKFSDVTQEFFGEKLGSNAKVAYILAFIITFLAVVVGISLLAKVLTRVADFSGIGILNNIGGALFGFARSLLLMSVLLNIFDKVNFTHVFASEETIAKSMLYHPVKAIGHVIYPFLSTELHEIRIKLPEQQNQK